MTDSPPPDTNRKPTFEERVDDFGRRADAAGERIEQRAEAAGRRLASDPAVVRAADTAGRVWGLIVLAVGVWFLLDVTFAMDMPRIPWGEVWPLAIIFIGLTILFRGMRRSD